LDFFVSFIFLALLKQRNHTRLCLVNSDNVIYSIYTIYYDKKNFKNPSFLEEKVFYKSRVITVQVANFQKREGKDGFPFPNQVEDRFHGNDRREIGNDRESNEIASLAFARGRFVSPPQ
jgi:hypothetical protein